MENKYILLLDLLGIALIVRVIFNNSDFGIIDASIRIILGLGLIIIGIVFRHFDKKEEDTEWPKK